MTTLIFSWLLLGERLNTVQYGCMVLILAGFALVVWTRRREEKEERRKRTVQSNGCVRDKISESSDHLEAFADSSSVAQLVFDDSSPTALTDVTGDDVTPDDIVTNNADVIDIGVDHAEDETLL